MKPIRSIILLAGALFFPSRFTTANAAPEAASAEDVEALKARIAELEKQFQSAPRTAVRGDAASAFGCTART